MLNPMSRIAYIVSVFATAHKHPASNAQRIRCGARPTSARIEDVPRIRAGRLHRARKTPTTMINEITTGGTPMVTSFVGTSAAPSQAPAANPDRIPSSCSFPCPRRVLRCNGRDNHLRIVHAPPSQSLSHIPQQQQPTHKHQHRHPEVHVRQHAGRPVPWIFDFRFFTSRCDRHSRRDYISTPLISQEQCNLTSLQFLKFALSPRSRYSP